ncbi:hypothetical protein AVEN_270735-1 [Araneus ventricosus]|uniref:Uncharacterized protein n=1 Tax=Araneus ventricosus TaxID=182803 RepID=A0A4Y2KR36_ARAVE|nr:hypothetical protein AVEN_270735-1 [Araneus ventricosus]
MRAICNRPRNFEPRSDDEDDTIAGTSFSKLLRGLVARSRLWGRRVPGSKPDSPKIRRAWGLLHAKSCPVAKRPPVGVAWKFGEGVPAHVSSSSSDRGSKLRGPSQNSPRVASKRDVNIAKLKKLQTSAPHR